MRWTRCQSWSPTRLGRTRSCCWSATLQGLVHTPDRRGRTRRRWMHFSNHSLESEEIARPDRMVFALPAGRVSQTDDGSWAGVMRSRTKSTVQIPRKPDRSDRKVELFPWDDVQYFLELVRKNTLLKAARRLGVSHTTVLRRIANLERRVDHKLFERTQKGFVLTE